MCLLAGLIRGNVDPFFALAHATLVLILMTHIWPFNDFNGLKLVTEMETVMTNDIDANNFMKVTE